MANKIRIDVGCDRGAFDPSGEGGEWVDGAIAAVVAAVKAAWPNADVRENRDTGARDRVYADPDRHPGAPTDQDVHAVTESAWETYCANGVA